MMRTARYLMVFFTPAAVYTCSDELTAIFMPPAERSCYPYAGRVQKVVSVSAGYISARFNYHISQQDHSTEPALGEKTADMKMYFDSRIGVVDSAEELFVRILFFCTGLVWMTHQSFCSCRKICDGAKLIV